MMKRRKFLHSMLGLPLTGKAMNAIFENKNHLSGFPEKRMPVMFVGHGNPMNALEINEFSKGWKAVVENIPTPRAILCVSAHWETRGTFITAMDTPRTIHDFYGFPDELFRVHYPAPGSPELAREISGINHGQTIEPDLGWGLDHGSWTILKHMFPEARIPVLQLSLNHALDPSAHYRFAKELAFLRQKGVLILGSGNIVHNLRLVNWRKSDDVFPWTKEATQKIKELIINKNHHALVNYTHLGKEVELSVPTPEHYLPMLYALALAEEDENITFFNDKIMMGSLSMTSFIIN